MLYNTAMKRNTTVRLSDEARDIQHAAATKLGISLSAVIEMAIRLLGQREGITKAGARTRAKTRAFPVKR